MRFMQKSEKKILITGVAGFIGRYVAQHFLAQKWFVIGVDSVSTENAPFPELLSYYSMKLPEPALHDVIKKHTPDVCIHCAGSASVGLSVTDPARDLYANTVLTFEVLNSLRLYAPQCRFIFLSSAAVYGNPKSLPVKETHPLDPISPYGFHKLQCELLCEEFANVYGMSTAILRVFSAYGPGLRRQVLWDICRKIIIEQSLTLQGTGNESRDFIHAVDIARAIDMVTSNAPMKGEVYNLASGKDVLIRELASMILVSFDSTLTPMFSQGLPVGTPSNWRADISKLNSLGFSVSLPIEQGVRAYSIWCHAELTGI